MINRLISELGDYAIANQLIDNLDRVYCTNRLLNLLKLGDFTLCTDYTKHENIEALLDDIIDYAAQNDILVQNTTTYRDILAADIMNCFTPFPSQIIEKFNKLYNQSKSLATDYYYNLSKATNYIMTNRIKRDIKWTVDTKYGQIGITINLSKPEKDPKDIAAAKNAVAAGYPKCLICAENEGFEGDVLRPARSNHRIVPIKLDNTDFYMQYSPYVYYNEHCIILNKEHVPMKIEKQTFKHLLSFVEQFPHYFIGSNADLPIVGGSILTHDHFQGGNYDFPMALCNARQELTFSGYEDISGCIVDWALSTIRIKGTDIDRLVSLADKILTTWRGYSDESNEIIAYTEDTPHNTITPIARYRDGNYELDLILRNNRTTKEHPLGIFHPHDRYHNIKKENIGLIEAMGLAILPSRLKSELNILSEALSDPKKEQELFTNQAMSHHYFFYSQLKVYYKESEQPLEYVKQMVGIVFSRILDNCGVFKDTPQGNEGFLAFISAVNMQ